MAEKADRQNSAIGDQASAIRLSQNLGLPETRRNKDQCEKSISVMEVGKIIIAETPSAQTASGNDYWNNAESRQSESSLDVRFRVRSEFIGQESENAGFD